MIITLKEIYNKNEKDHKAILKILSKQNYQLIKQTANWAILIASAAFLVAVGLRV